MHAMGRSTPPMAAGLTRTLGNPAANAKLQKEHPFGHGTKPFAPSRNYDHSLQLKASLQHLKVPS